METLLTARSAVTAPATATADGYDLAGAVVVVTGASSGIGRAAAHAFAREGARLALAARSEEPLRDTRAECERVGAEALEVPTDVRDEQAVERLAERAVERFGRIDVWVNGAAVMAYGRFDEIPSDVFRAVIETNVLGQSHGARAALPRFRSQGTGVLINMASVWGRVTTPHVSPYVTSKFAVRALSECLRLEARDLPDVSVATILPEAVDTPIFAAAANYAGRAARPVPPLCKPEDVAEGIVRCARSPRDEVTFGRLGRMLELLHVAAPRLYARLLTPAFMAGNYGRAPTRPTAGNVLEPRAEAHAVEGGWRQRGRADLARALLATLGGVARGLLPRRLSVRLGRSGGSPGRTGGS